MKRILLTIILTIISILIFAQKAMQINAVKVNAEFEYPESYQKISYGKDSCVLIKIITKDQKIIMTGKLKSKESMIKEGRFTYYDLEIKPIVIGRYSNDIPIGVWQCFDTNGNVVKQLNYSKALDYLSSQNKIDEFYYLTDKMPIFKTETCNDFSEYLHENIVFPINSIVNRVNERVFVSFVVNKQGKIVNPEIIQGQNLDLNIEIIRVLSECPEWAPGYNKKGETQNIKYTYPIEFLSRNEELITKADSNSTLFEVGFNYSLKKTQAKDYIYKQYYPSTKKIIQYMTYKDSKMNTKHGKVINWLDNGIVYEEGQYLYNSKDGEWKYYDYEKGFLKEYGNFKTDKKTGVWTTLDSVGNLKSEFKYVNNVKHGIFTIYTKDGKITESGIYKKGLLKSRNVISKDTCLNGTIIEEKIPYLKICEEQNIELVEKCTDLELRRHISLNVNYPIFAKENGIYGTAIVKFVVNKRGKIDNIKVYRGICDEIKDECYKVIESIPDWNPGNQNGEFVDVSFYVPITFQVH